MWRERRVSSPVRRRGGYRFFLLVERDEDLDRRDGTLAPFSRASLRPMAIACLRLVTLRPDPLLSVPFFRRCIADRTVSWLFFPYLALDPPAMRRARDVPMARSGRVGCERACLVSSA